jgi:hypothetical protein
MAEMMEVMMKKMSSEMKELKAETDPAKMQEMKKEMMNAMKDMPEMAEMSEMMKKEMMKEMMKKMDEYGDMNAMKEGFSSDAQRKAAFASGYKEKDKKKDEMAKMNAKHKPGHNETMTKEKHTPSHKEMAMNAMKMNAMRMPIKSTYKKEMKTGDDDMTPMSDMNMNAVYDKRKMNAMTMQNPKQDMAAGYMKSDVRAAVKNGGGTDMAKVKDAPKMQTAMKKINAMYKTEKYLDEKEGSIQNIVAQMYQAENRLVEVQDKNLEKMISDYLKKGGTITKLPPALAKGMKASGQATFKVGDKGVIKSTYKMKEVREFVDTYNKHFLVNYKAEELMVEARYEVSHDYGSRFGSYGVRLTAVVDATSPQDAMKKGHDKLETLSMSTQSRKNGVDELQDPDDEGKPSVKITSKPITYTDMKKF